MSDSLLTKYRPDSWKKVIGHDAVVASMEKNIMGKKSPAYLLIGPSGVGKTTLARIAAEAAGCASQDREEFDAGEKTGVDEMRGLLDGLMYRPLGEGAVKAVILDECHMLSKNAWNALLKSLEDAPDWVIWFLCTTDAKKVPKTVVTRCLKYELSPVKTLLLEDLLEDVCEGEDLKLAKGVISLCAMEAEGSARQAIANLAVCAEARDRKEAAELLQSAAEAPGAVDLARALFKLPMPEWPIIQDLIKGLGDVDAESVRYVICGYGTTIALSSPNYKQVGRVIEVLDVFCDPFKTKGMAPLITACGKVLLNG